MKKKITLALFVCSAFFVPILNISASTLAENKIFKDEVIKVYKLKPDETFKADEKISEYFKDEKITREYKIADQKVEEKKTTDEKLITQTLTYSNLSTNDGSGVDNFIDYTYQGYVGRLEKLSVAYEPIYETRSWNEQKFDTISKSYTLLKSPEFSSIPKTVDQDGFTYYLRTNDSNFTFDPASYSYTCSAIYTKVTDVPKSEEYITGYNATANYQGTVKAENVSEKIATVTYKLDKETADPEPKKEEGINPFLVVGGVTGAGLATGALTKGLIIPFWKRKKNKENTNNETKHSKIKK